MNQELALRLLGEVMQWDSERATQEYAWLQLFSRFKYDEYADFIAGLRFIESLANWLQQFEVKDREAAYMFIRSNLLFFSESEIEHLIELMYPDVVEPMLRTEVATSSGIPEYLIWSRSETRRLFNVLLRKCLFFGLSDGARIDVFRRANVGRISNEQILLAPDISPEKWKRLHRDLQKDIGGTAKFQYLFLLDDFAGTGYTASQRLLRFWDNVKPVLGDLLDSDCRVVMHHYVASEKARVAIADADKTSRTQRSQDWFPGVQPSFGMILSNDLKITASGAPDFWPLIQKYYDPAVRSTHTDKGGTDDVRLGFGSCALPLVLEHNTPNDSIALIWGETSGGAKVHAMRPLFRRRQRHIDFKVDRD
jgi:hypothetical protein